MTQAQKTKTRGRPRTITRERITDAGIRIGLPKITFVGLAAEMGVSHMALYKHVPNLKALKALVAEAIFEHWEIPEIANPSPDKLESYLNEFALSLRNLVRLNPGLPPYLLRRSVATPHITEKIREHQKVVAAAFNLSSENSRWLLSTVAFHCIAVADTLYSKDDETIELDRLDEEEIEREFNQGINALIIGALKMMAQEESQLSAP